MSSYNAIEWSALGLSLVALYFVGNKSRMGFAIFMASHALWFGVALAFDIYALMINATLLFAMNLRNYLKWKPDKANK